MSSSVTSNKNAVAHFESITISTYNQANVHDDPVGILCLNFRMNPSQGGMDKHLRWDPNCIGNCRKDEHFVV